MLKIKIYKYDSAQESNGYRGTDYSAYVLQGFQDTEDITQELDTSEITLCGLTQAKEFDPETKFIIDFVKIDTESNEIIQNTLHRVVARDMVSQPILSDETYYDHHISLIEPSVIAQKRLVDNISATYKLKDVSLEQAPNYHNTVLSYGFKSSEFEPQRFFQQNVTVDFFRTYYNLDFGKYFKLDGDLVITNAQGQVSNVYNNIEDFRNQDNTYTANFQLPKLEIYVGKKDTFNFEMVGHASLHYRICEYNLNDQTSPVVIREDNIISNDNLGAGASLSSEAWQSTINGEWLYEGYNIVGLDYYGYNGHPEYRYKKYTNRSAGSPDYTISNVPIQVDKQYVLEVSLYQFPDNLPSFQYSSRSVKYTGSQPCYYSSLSADYSNSTPLKQNVTRQMSSILTNANTTSTTELKTYSATSKSMVYNSSIPYSALALLQKAILNCSLYKKKDGVYIADVNNSDLPFIISNKFADSLENDQTSLIDTLSATRVIENFYNQKNLWEIMVEVGHYIHAIPELRFGADDKFEITFNRLGRTDQHIDSSTKVSIYNSRSVEDYISATSSYVSNMVQLGGYIQEWVAPKTSNDTLLIANDTASILTTKPIIELLEIQVKANINQTLGGLSITAGDTVDLTPYIYEENVYKTLSINVSDNPNKGIAMYYRLGTNEITGGQYRLPRPSYDIYNDYTFKKVIWCAFNGGYEVYSGNITSGYWTDLKVNNFTFLIRYRTKDDVRQNHVRPDLRKYLLNSKYDKYPEHNQFNNQQDILVDSIKFGNNVYGKLIKTGNSEYTKQEWVENFDDVKHKGELYNINGSLYYVAQITNTYYADHIVSEVKFSKDYNELSAVIGIPSEPRFYEISEQSQIRREVAINDIAILTDDANLIAGATYDPYSVDTNFVFDFSNLKTLLFSEGTAFPKYALTAFKGDEDTATYDQTAGQPYLYKEVISPINAYSSENTLTYEWDMADNFSAGDKVVSTNQISYGSYLAKQSPISGTPTTNTIDNGSYNSLWAVPYTDTYGKSALMDFFIIKDIDNINTTQIQALPESPVTAEGRYVGTYTANSFPSQNDLNSYLSFNIHEFDMLKLVITETINGQQVTNYYKAVAILTNMGGQAYTLIWNFVQTDENWKPENTTYIGDTDIFATNEKGYKLELNNRGLSLLKDCREAISCNYNLQLISNSDTFVFSPFMFLPEKTNVKVVLLANEVNKFTDGYIDNGEIITPLNTSDVSLNPLFDLTTEDRGRTTNYWTGTIFPTDYVYNSMGIDLSTTFANVNEKHFQEQTDPTYQRVKAIAIVCEVNMNPSEPNSNANAISGKTQFIMARNIPETWSKEDAIKNWYIGPHKKSTTFTNTQ